MLGHTGGTEAGASVVLAADVGGTHARIGLVGLWPSQHQPVTFLAGKTYQGAQWPSLVAILNDYLTTLALEARPTRAVIAIAGYPQDGVIISQNLPWPVSIQVLQQALGLAELRVVNDFAALAAAVRWLPAGEGRGLIEGREAVTEGQPVVVLGPGTGLGCAALLGDAQRRMVLPTEAGQIALAAGTARELTVLRHLLQQHDPVLTGDVLSGPGLLLLYRCLLELDGRMATGATPSEVSQAALTGGDPLAVEALEIFCGLLGSLCGDLAILFGATGGIYLAGGILPSIEPFLRRSSFPQRFFNKGVMQPFLSRIPVRLIDHGQLGIIGAAETMLRP
ncbi:glucokinase [Frateuria aurantia]